MPGCTSARKITCWPKPSGGTRTRPTTQRHSRVITHLGDLDVGSRLTGVLFSSGVEMVEMHQRVEDEEVAALGFAAPDGIVRKEDDVPFLERNVDHRGVLCNLAAVFDEARHEQ